MSPSITGKEAADGQQQTSQDNAAIRLSDLLSDRFSPIQSAILSNLDPADIANLTRTSSEMPKIQDVLAAGDYNISKALRQFFDKPLEFRNLQAKWNALLAGDFVAVLLARKSLRGKCMTVNIKEDYRNEVESYLVETGYNLTVPHDPTTNINCVRYEKGSEAIIEVWWSGSPPILDVLNRAYHTALLNVISWNKAYALYPVTTFVEQDAYLLKRVDDEAMSKPLRSIAQSGWATKSIHWKQQDRGGQYQGLTRPRQIKDKYTWSFKLSTEGMTPSDVPDSVLESTTFRLYCWDRGRRNTYYQMSAECIFRHPALKYEYVTRGIDDANPSYQYAVDYLEKRLAELTLIEILKMPKSERSTELEDVLEHEGRGIRNLRQNFVPPSTWQFHDATLVDYLEDMALRDDVRHKERDQRREARGIKTMTGWQDEDKICK